MENMKNPRRGSVNHISPSIPVGMSTTSLLVHSWTDGRISQSLASDSDQSRTCSALSQNPSNPALVAPGERYCSMTQPKQTDIVSIWSPPANASRLIKEENSSRFSPYRPESPSSRLDVLFRWFTRNRLRSTSSTSVLNDIETTVLSSFQDFDDDDRQNKRKDEVKEIKKTLRRTCLSNFLSVGSKEERRPEGGICCPSELDDGGKETRRKSKERIGYRLENNKTQNNSSQNHRKKHSPSDSSSSSSPFRSSFSSSDIDRLIQMTPGKKVRNEKGSQKTNTILRNDENKDCSHFQEDHDGRKSHSEETDAKTIMTEKRTKKRISSSFNLGWRREERKNFQMKKSSSNFEMGSLLRGSSTESLRRRSSLLTKGHLTSAFTLNEEEEDAQFILSSDAGDNEKDEEDLNEEKRLFEYDYREKGKKERLKVEVADSAHGSDKSRLSSTFLQESTSSISSSGLSEINSTSNGLGRLEKCFPCDDQYEKERDSSRKKCPSGKCRSSHGSTTCANDSNKLPSALNYCPLCLERLPSKDFVSLSSCGCSFCLECLTSYLTICIGENVNVPFLSCPDSNCPQLLPQTTMTLPPESSSIKSTLRRSLSILSRKSTTSLQMDSLTSTASNVISRDEVAKCVDEKTLKLYDKLMLEYQVEKDPFKTFCPTPNCDNVCIISKNVFSSIKEGSSTRRGSTNMTRSPTLSSLASSISPATATALLLTAKKEKEKFPSTTPVHCIKCDNNFCLFCRKSFHPGLPCSSSTEEDLKNFMISKGLDASDIKKCPRCSVWIERDDGCAQMMCKKCRHVFCWFCLESLEDDFLLRHYDKGPCKNKLGHSRASVLWHRTQVVGIFAGFGVLLLLASPLFLLIGPCFLCCNCCCRKGCHQWLSDDSHTNAVNVQDSRRSRSSIASSSSFPYHDKIDFV